MDDSGVVHRSGLKGTLLFALSLGGCASNGGDDNTASVEDLEPPNRLVAVVRTSSLQWEGEQTYIPLYADGTASGLVVVNLNGG